MSIIDPDNGPDTDYTSLETWENQNLDLTSLTRTEPALIRPSSGSACVLTGDFQCGNGWVTSSSYYIDMKPYSSAYSHSFQGWDDTKARIIQTSSDAGHAFYIYDKHMKLTDMQLDRYGVYAGPFIRPTTSALADTTTIRGCIIYGSVYATRPRDSIRALPNYGRIYILNNLFIGYCANSIIEFAPATQLAGCIYNNTIHVNNNVHSIKYTTANKTYPDLRNNISVNIGSGQSYYFASPVTYVHSSNYSDDTTSPDGSEYHSVTPDWVDDPNDYHLASTDDGNFEGTDLSSDSTYPFSLDAEGDLRSDWDAGWDEYYVAGPGPPAGEYIPHIIMVIE